ncbi:hypothetical protein [Pararhizobium sp. O133]|uniref:hypothetical protein n=1 Tax=Pararhizobium sp. O133 TaxID=3449278 RepID=UPI003F6873F3
MITANPPHILFDEDAVVLRRLLADQTLAGRAKVMIRAKLDGAANVSGNVAMIDNRITYRPASGVAPFPPAHHRQARVAPANARDRSCVRLRLLPGFSV